MIFECSLDNICLYDCNFILPLRITNPDLSLFCFCSDGDSRTDESFLDRHELRGSGGRLPACFNFETTLESLCGRMERKHRLPDFMDDAIVGDRFASPCSVPCPQWTVTRSPLFFFFLPCSV